MAGVWVSVRGRRACAMATLVVTEDLAAPATIGRGGQSMHVLQWLHGFRRLGHRVLFVEFLKEDPGDAREASVRYFHGTMATWWDPAWSALISANSSDWLYGVALDQASRTATGPPALI